MHTTQQQHKCWKGANKKARNGSEVIVYVAIIRIWQYVLVMANYIHFRRAQQWHCLCLPGYIHT